MSNRFVVYWLGLLLCFWSETLNAQLQRFSGTWKNTNPHARSITRLRVDVIGKQVTLHAWGKCSPVDCDWGSVDGVLYGPDVRADAIETTRVVVGSFVDRIRNTLLIVRVGDNGRVSAEILTRYADLSGRSNVTDDAILERDNAAAVR